MERRYVKACDEIRDIHNDVYTNLQFVMNANTMYSGDTLWGFYVYAAGEGSVSAMEYFVEYGVVGLDGIDLCLRFALQGDNVHTFAYLFDLHNSTTLSSENISCMITSFSIKCAAYMWSTRDTRIAVPWCPEFACRDKCGEEQTICSRHMAYYTQAVASATRSISDDVLRVVMTYV